MPDAGVVPALLLHGPRMRSSSFATLALVISLVATSGREAVAHADATAATATAPSPGAKIASLLGPAIPNRRIRHALTGGFAARVTGLVLIGAGLATAATPAIRDRTVDQGSTAGALLTAAGTSLFLAGHFYDDEDATAHNSLRRLQLQHVRLTPMLVGTATPSTVGLGVGGGF